MSSGLSILAAVASKKKPLEVGSQKPLPVGSRKPQKAKKKEGVKTKVHPQMQRELRKLFGRNWQEESFVYAIKPMIVRGLEWPEPKVRQAYEVMRAIQNCKNRTNANAKAKHTSTEIATQKQILQEENFQLLREQQELNTELKALQAAKQDLYEGQMARQREVDQILEGGFTTFSFFD